MTGNLRACQDVRKHTTMVVRLLYGTAPGKVACLELQGEKNAQL